MKRHLLPQLYFLCCFIVFNTSCSDKDEFIKESERPSYNPSVYKISSQSLGDWDEGYTLYNEQDEASSLYILGKYNMVENNYVIHFNKLGNTEAEDGITFYLDSDKNIQTIFINSLCYSAINGDNDAILYIGIDKEGNVKDSFLLESSSTRLNTSFKVNRSIYEGMNLALDARTTTQALVHLNKKEYGEVVAAIGPDVLIGTLNLDPKTKLITAILIEAFTRLYFNMIRNDYYDGCIPQITNVTHDKITVSIADVEKLSNKCLLEFTGLITSKKVFLVVAIGDAESNGYVTYSNCKLKTSQIQINNNSSTVEVPLPSNLKIGTYYLHPLLITDQVLEKRFETVREWYIQYGATEVLKFPNVTINKIKQNDCRYSDYEHVYSVDLTIDCEIDGLDGVSEWGIKVYNDKGYVEKELTTISTKNKYSFHYQDVVSEVAFDKKTQSAEFLIVPIAKGLGNNEMVYCEAKRFEVKVCYTTCTDNKHPHAIDLGLPSGTKWCCCNVGANIPEGYGGYYAWGETREKSTYSWDNYAFCSSTGNISDIGSNIAGTDYDVATEDLGAPWRMPSTVQQKELVNNCSFQRTEQNGVQGILVTGPNGGQIFLPAAGYRYNDHLSYPDSHGYYWSSSLFPEENWTAYHLYFSTIRDQGYWYYGEIRYYGLSVRAVRP